VDLRADLVLSLEVDLGPAHDLGTLFEGPTVLIPIVGGRVWGTGGTGRILAGGGDWNTRQPGNLTRFHARYSWDDGRGSVVTIVNEGVVPADLGLTRFKTVPRFQADPAGPWGPLTWGVHVATLDTSALDRGRVTVEVYRLP